MPKERRSLTFQLDRWVALGGGDFQFFFCRVVAFREELEMQKSIQSVSSFLFVSNDLPSGTIADYS